MYLDRTVTQAGLYILTFTFSLPGWLHACFRLPRTVVDNPFHVASQLKRCIRVSTIHIKLNIDIDRHQSGMVGIAAGPADYCRSLLLI